MTKDNIRDKIEEVFKTYVVAHFAENIKTGEVLYVTRDTIKLVDELTTLLEEQRADAVRGFVMHFQDWNGSEVPYLEEQSKEYLKEQNI